MVSAYKKKLKHIIGFVCYSQSDELTCELFSAVRKLIANNFLLLFKFSFCDFARTVCDFYAKKCFQVRQKYVRCVVYCGGYGVEVIVIIEYAFLIEK